MNVHAILEKAGLRSTLPRILVLEFFREHAKAHLGAEQIYKLINEGTGNVSLATVYRVLGQLADVNLLSAVDFGDGRTVYELDDGCPHDHVVCTRCGRIDEFFDAEIEARQEAVAKTLDFALSGRRLVLFGLCVTCRKSGARAKRRIRPL